MRLRRLVLGAGECCCVMGVGVSAAALFEGLGLRNCLAGLRQVFALLRLTGLVRHARLEELLYLSRHVRPRRLAKSLLEVPTRKSYKSVRQECPIKVSHKRILQAYKGIAIINSALLLVARSY